MLQAMKDREARERKEGREYKLYMDLGEGMVSSMNFATFTPSKAR